MKDLKKLLKLNINDDSIVNHLESLNKNDRKHFIDGLKWVNDHFDCAPNGGVLYDIIEAYEVTK